jgi:hypothetical protein
MQAIVAQHEALTQFELCYCILGAIRAAKLSQTPCMYVKKAYLLSFDRHKASCGPAKKFILPLPSLTRAGASWEPYGLQNSHKEHF